MSFPENLNYAQSYAQSLAQAFPYVLNFGALYATPNNGRYRIKGGKKVELPVISTGGRTAGDRDSVTSVSRNYENSWEEKTLSNHRQWSTLVHPQDIDQTDYAASIANITSVFNNEHKFPEMDAYTVSTIYSLWREQGCAPVRKYITPDTVLDIFDELMQKMSEARVPASGRILYVTPAVMKTLKSATQLRRSFDVKSATGEINRAVTVLDGVQVVEVPPALMMTAYSFENGWEAGIDAEQINMLLIHPESVITPVSYEFARLDEPSALTSGKYVYYEESFEDVFILNNRTAGIAFVLPPVPVSGISLDKASASVALGSSLTLTATVAPADASYTGVKWSSSDAGVASVSSDGIVTGVSAGCAVVTAETEDGGFTDTCAVTVSAG